MSMVISKPKVSVLKHLLWNGFIATLAIALLARCVGIATHSALFIVLSFLLAIASIPIGIWTALSIPLRENKILCRCISISIGTVSCVLLFGIFLKGSVGANLDGQREAEDDACHLREFIIKRNSGQYRITIFSIPHVRGGNVCFSAIVIDAESRQDPPAAPLYANVQAFRSTLDHSFLNPVVHVPFAVGKVLYNPKRDTFIFRDRFGDAVCNLSKGILGWHQSRRAVDEGEAIEAPVIFVQKSDDALIELHRRIPQRPKTVNSTSSAKNW